MNISINTEILKLFEILNAAYQSSEKPIKYLVEDLTFSTIDILCKNKNFNIVDSLFQNLDFEKWNLDFLFFVFVATNPAREDLHHRLSALEGYKNKISQLGDEEMLRNLNYLR